MTVKFIFTAEIPGNEAGELFERIGKGQVRAAVFNPITIRLPGGTIVELKLERLGATE